MKKLATVIAVTALIGTPAFAADMAVKAPPPAAPAPVDIWTGGYVGLNAGYDWGHDSINSGATPGACDTVGFGGCDLPPINGVSDASAAALSFTTSVNHSGFIGGGQAGYNWLVPSWNSVLGIEIDFQGKADSHSDYLTNVAPVPGCPALCAAAFVVAQQGTLTEKIDTLGTLRARGGFLAGPNTLFYVTGGLAFAHASASANFTQTGIPLFGAVNQPWAGGGSVSKELFGPTVGGGIEWKCTPNLSLKAEYLYADLGSMSFNTTLQSTSTGGLIYSTANANVQTHVHDNIARVGINYTFR